jgi:TPR repeat protein
MARHDFPQDQMAGMVSAQAAPQAFYELGMMYASGRAAPADLVTAHKWLNVAVARGFKAAVARRAEIAQEMSADEIAEAQRNARLFLTCH